MTIFYVKRNQRNKVASDVLTDKSWQAVQPLYTVVICGEVSHLSSIALNLLRQKAYKFDLFIDIPLVRVFAENKYCRLGINSQEFYILYHLLLTPYNSWTAGELKKVIEYYRGVPINTDIPKIVNRLKNKTQGILNNRLKGDGGRYRIENPMNYAIILGSESIPLYGYVLSSNVSAPLISSTDETNP